MNIKISIDCDLCEKTITFYSNVDSINLQEEINKNLKINKWHNSKSCLCEECKIKVLAEGKNCLSCKNSHEETERIIMHKGTFISKNQICNIDKSIVYDCDICHKYEKRTN